MAATRTIEEYVDEIVTYITEVEFDSLSTVSETLMRMKNNSKSKYKLNYWRVMQCLGETASDRLVTFLVKLEKHSCKCHFHTNFKLLMQLFVESMCNVKVIKRMLAQKVRMIPMLFKAVRQTDDAQLAVLGLDAMTKCTIVGQTDLAEFLVKYGIMKDLYQVLKTRCDAVHINFSYASMNTVLSCSKLLLSITVCGNDSIRKQVRRGSATRTLSDYVERFCTSEEAKRKFAMDTKFDIEKMFPDFTELLTVLGDEKQADLALKTWKPKLKLQSAQEQDQLYLFCSSPSCRKIYSECEKFRYCGACRLAQYCSADCQKEHWKKGHKDSCQRDTSLVFT